MTRGQKGENMGVVNETDQDSLLAMEALLKFKNSTGNKASSAGGKMFFEGGRKERCCLPDSFHSKPPGSLHVAVAQHSDVVGLTSSAGSAAAAAAELSSVVFSNDKTAKGEAGESISTKTQRSDQTTKSIKTSGTDAKNIPSSSESSSRSTPKPCDNTAYSAGAAVAVPSPVMKVAEPLRSQQDFSVNRGSGHLHCGNTSASQRTPIGVAKQQMPNSFFPPAIARSGQQASFVPIMTAGVSPTGVPLFILSNTPVSFSMSNSVSDATPHAPRQHVIMAASPTAPAAPSYFGGGIVNNQGATPAGFLQNRVATSHTSTAPGDTLPATDGPGSSIHQGQQQAEAGLPSDTSIMKQMLGPGQKIEQVDKLQSIRQVGNSPQMIAEVSILPPKKRQRTTATSSISDDKKKELPATSTESTPTSESHAPSSPSPPDCVIRNEEIQAALKSRPQRGRKRENLTVMERLELTRTRNREHAKSTRIRKKMRYEELLEIEQKFKEFQHKEELDNKRRKCLEKFMTIRTKMLHDLAESAQTETEGSIRLCEKQKDETFKKSKDNHLDDTHRLPQAQLCQVSNARNGAGSTTASSDSPEGKSTGVSSKDVRCVSFSSVEMTLTTPSTDRKETNGTSLNSSGATCSSDEGQINLEDVIENIRDFTFLPMQAKYESSLEQKPNEGLRFIRDQDKSILELTQRYFGNESISSVLFRLHGTTDSIPVTATNVAYAEFEVAVGKKENNSSAIVFAGVMKVEFPSGSSKIRSARWCSTNGLFKNTASPSFKETKQDCSASHSSSESLGYQKSFPSVVSLDQTSGESGYNKDATGQTAALEGNSARRREGGKTEIHGHVVLEDNHDPGMLL